MLFELLPEIAAIDFAKDDSSRKALRNLLLAVNSGLHIICAERETLEQMVKVLGASGDLFDVDAKHTVKYALENYTFQKSMFDKAKFKVQLGNNGITQQITPDIWRISLKNLSNPSTVGKVRLLAENLLDCYLYEYAAKHFAVKNQLSKFYLAIDPIGGGGSTISSLFEQSKQQSTPCICITDSDKFSPQSPDSNTTLKCFSQLDTSAWMLRFLAIEGRDIENILPKGVVNATLNELKTGNDLHHRWEILKEMLDKLSIKNVYLYTDLKNGITHGWIEKLNNQKDVSFWAGVKSDLAKNPLPNSSLRMLRCSECCELPDQDLMAHFCDDCRLITGICKDLATHVLEWLKERTHQKSAELVSSVDDTHWLEVGERVFWLSFAQKVKRL